MEESTFARLTPERQLNVFRTVQEGIESHPPRQQATFVNVCRAYAAEQSLLDAAREGRLDHGKVTALQQFVDDAGGVLCHGLTSQGANSVAYFRESTFGRMERLLPPDVQGSALQALNARLRQQPLQTIEELFSGVRQFLEPAFGLTTSGSGGLAELDGRMQRRLFETIAAGAADPRGLVDLPNVVAALVAERAVVQAARLGQLQEGQLIDLERSIDAAGGEIAPGLRSKGPGSVATFRSSLFGWISDNLPVRVQPAALWTLNALLAHRAPAGLDDVLATGNEFLDPLQRQGALQGLRLERQIRVFETLRDSFHSRPALHSQPFREIFTAVVRVLDLEQEMVVAPGTGQSFVERISRLDKALDATGRLLVTDDDAASPDGIHAFCTGPLDRIRSGLPPELFQACFAALNSRLVAAQPPHAGTRAMVASATSFLEPVLQGLYSPAEPAMINLPDPSPVADGLRPGQAPFQQQTAPTPVQNPHPVPTPEPVVLSTPTSPPAPIALEEPSATQENLASPEPVVMMPPVTVHGPEPESALPSTTIAPTTANASATAQVERVVATLESADTTAVQFKEPPSEPIEVPVREPVTVESPVEAENRVPVRPQPDQSLGLIDDFSSGSLRTSQPEEEVDDATEQDIPEPAERARRRFRIRFNLLLLLVLPAGGLSAYQVTQQLSRTTQQTNNASPALAVLPPVPVAPVTSSPLSAPPITPISSLKSEIPSPSSVADDTLELLSTPLPDLPAPIAMPIFVAPSRQAVATPPPVTTPHFPSTASPASPSFPASTPNPTLLSPPSSPTGAVAPPAPVVVPQTVKLSMDSRSGITFDSEALDPAVWLSAQPWSLKTFPSLAGAGLESIPISRPEPTAVHLPSNAPVRAPQSVERTDPYVDLPIALRESLRQQVHNLLVRERLDRRIRVLPAGRVRLSSPLASARRVEHIPMVMFTDGQIVLLKHPSDSSLMSSIQTWVDAQPLPPKGYVTPVVLSFQPRA